MFTVIGNKLKQTIKCNMMLSQGPLAYDYWLNLNLVSFLQSTGDLIHVKLQIETIC